MKGAAARRWGLEDLEKLVEGWKTGWGGNAGRIRVPEGLEKLAMVSWLIYGFWTRKYFSGMKEFQFLYLVESFLFHLLQKAPSQRLRAHIARKSLNILNNSSIPGSVISYRAINSFAG